MQRYTMLHSKQQFLSLHYQKSVAQICKKSVAEKTDPVISLIISCNTEGKAVKVSLRTYINSAHCHNVLVANRTKATSTKEQGHAKSSTWLFQWSGSVMVTWQTTHQSPDKNYLSQAYFQHKLGLVFTLITPGKPSSVTMMQQSCPRTSYQHISELCHL